MWFCNRSGIFIFSSDFDGFYSFDSSQWELPVVSQQIFSIFYRFRAKRGWRSGGGQYSISYNMEKFNFSHDFHGVFYQMIHHEKCKKSYSKHFLVKFTVFCIKGVYGCVQHFTVSSTLLCPAYYCVQQNTVSTLTQRFVCSTFTCQHAAVVSCCACEAPELYIKTHISAS